MVENYWSRLKAEMDAQGWGVPQLASAMGVSYQAVVKVRDGGSFNLANNMRAAKALKLNPTWLATGKGPKRESEERSNVSAGPQAHGPYPLISQVQAGAWTELCDGFAPGDAEEWLPSTRNLGKCGYLLRVSGKSMENPGGRYHFPEGMILHVNPDLDPVPTQFVVVRRESTQEATFKRYVLLEGQPYLEAINPDWPKDMKYLKLQKGDTWCGVVVDASLGGLP